MSQRHGQLLKWIAGIVGSVIAGVLVLWLVGPGGFLNADPTPEPDPLTVWRQGTLVIPLTVGDRGQVVDLDGGRLLPLGTSISARDSDMKSRETGTGPNMELKAAT